VIKRMAIIKVPKTPKRAFNDRRKPSDLLRRQIEHLEWAIRPAAERKPGKLKVKPVRTEGEAAARIARLTERLHPQASKSAVSVEAPKRVGPRKPRGA
jgi:hypothetical protein